MSSGTKKSNHSKILSEIVNLKGWHLPFNSRRRKVKLHVQAGFREGLFTTSDDIPFPFEVTINKAEILVWHDESEQCKFVTDTENIPTAATVTRTKSQSKKSGLAASVKGMKLKGAKSTSEKIQEKTTAQEICYWEYSNRARAWMVNSTTGEPLNGQPWNAKREPRIQISDGRTNVTDGMPPVIRIAIRCNAKDIDISIPTEFFAKMNFLSPNKLLAAKAHLKQSLIDIGLPPGENLETPHEMVVFADVLAEELD